ncbi:MAG: hypothetical protein HYR60_06685 [Acidobacteria bacterium]|nr:hypothetical protein [Acidobacteriota bacterium]
MPVELSRLRWLRDLVWPALFLVLAYTSASPHPLEVPLLFGLAALQMLEPRVAVFRSPRGGVAAVLLKLLLTYLLIGYTGGLESSYYLLLLLPVVSAATAFGPLASLAFTALACGVYLSFVLLLDPSRFRIDNEQYHELWLRIVVFALVGYSTNTLAALSREQSRKYRAVAEQLAEANRNLSEAEAAIRRSERLAALGQLSAGLAHELRNPLGTIKASAQVLSNTIGADNTVGQEMAGFISTEVDRTNLLVTRFLEFARPLQLRMAQVDLGEVIDRAVTQLERGTPHYDVEVYKNYSPEIPPFAFDADLTERVFFNLLLNAAQATPPGGAITVKTRLVDGTVEIAVIDRAAGIDARHLENIFNPFFTTKPDGVGLGLAIVSKIVDEHGGRITVESELGKGSVFRVYLPVQKAA